MAVVFKNRRGTMGFESLDPRDDESCDVRGESPGSIAAREAVRHAARAEVKQQIAEAIAAEETWTNLKAAVREAEQDKNDATSDSYDQSRKAQEEIELIDEQHVEGATTGLKQTPEAKARRAQLVKLVGRLEDEREKLSEPHDRIIEQLKAQCLEAKKKTGYCHHQAALIQLARPDLYAAMRLAHGEWSTSMNKLDALKAKRTKCDPADSQMCAFWDSQIAASEQRVAGAKAAMDAALQAVCDE